MAYFATDSQPAARHLRGRGHGLGRFLLGTVLGIVLGAFLAEPLEQIDEYAAFHVLENGRTPDCRDPGWYTEVTASASSYSDATGEGSYQRTLDGDKTTAWVGRVSGDVSLDWIAWEFPRETELKLICIRNGAAATYDSMAAHQRLKTAEFSGCGPVSSVSFADPIDLNSGQWLDRPSFETLTASDCTAERITLTVKETYPASRATSTISISDVKFYESKLPWD